MVSILHNSIATLAQSDGPKIHEMLGSRNRVELWVGGNRAARYGGNIPPIAAYSLNLERVDFKCNSLPQHFHGKDQPTKILLPHQDPFRSS
jgi:hypothetical protein